VNKTKKDVARIELILHERTLSSKDGGKS
jgi:ribosomal protein L29